MVSISSSGDAFDAPREAGAEQGIDHQGSALEQAGRQRRNRALPLSRGPGGIAAQVAGAA